MKAKDERKQLEEMLENSSPKVGKDIEMPENTNLLTQIEPLINVDFVNLKEKCEDEAKIMIKNAISFMIPADMIAENDYINNKFNVDVMSLAGMLYQLRSNEIVQKTLMEQINMGMTHPRMFEVFTGMSKTIGDLNKQLLQTVEAIRETYKIFKEDVKEKRTEKLGPSQNSIGMITTGNGGVVTRGTKDIINRLKGRKSSNGEDDYIDDAKLIPDISIDEPM